MLPVMKKITNSLLILFFVIAVISCKENDGDYDFVNKESVFQGSTLEYFKSKPGIFDSLLVALERVPELQQDIASKPITVFAPTNASFQSALINLNLVRLNQKKTPLYLKTIDVAHLDTLLNKYFVSGLVTSDSMIFVDGLYVNTLKYNQPMHAQRVKQQASGFVDGGIVTIYYSDTKYSTFTQNWTRTTTQGINIKTNNGVIHVLSNNHEFGFSEFLIKMNK